MAPPSRRKGAREQLHSAGRVLLVGAAVLGVAYVLAYVLAHAFDREFTLLIEDPAYILGGPLYTGAFVYLGFLGWWTAAVTTAMAAWLLIADGRRTEAAPLLWLAGLSAFLAADDMFQFHESVLDERIGVPQYVTFAAYMALVALFVARQLDFIRRNDWLLLVIAAGLMLIATIVDQFGDIADNHHDTTEEGLELLAILAWMLFSVRCATSRLAPLPRED